jgi:glycerophosphoryl diester phosphodiesterase
MNIANDQPASVSKSSGVGNYNKQNIDLIVKKILKIFYLSHVGVRLNNIQPGQPGPSPWMAGLDIDDFGGSIPQAVKAAGGKYWAPYYKYLTYALLEEAHQLGLKVYVWTVDSRRDMERFKEMGVDGIITNRPGILKSVVGLP